MKTKIISSIQADFLDDLNITKDDVKNCEAVLDNRDFNNEKIIFCDTGIKIPEGISNEEERFNFLTSKGRVALLADEVAIAAYNVINKNLQVGQDVSFRYISQGKFGKVKIPIYNKAKIIPKNTRKNDIFEYPEGEGDERVFGIYLYTRLLPLIGTNTYLRVQSDLVRGQISEILGLKSNYLGEMYSKGEGAECISNMLIKSF